MFAGTLFGLVSDTTCSVKHASIRSALERFVPSCPVFGFGRSYLVVVVHDTNFESCCVLGVNGGGSCRGLGYLFGCFCQQRYVLTNHIRGCICIITVYIENVTRSRPSSLDLLDVVVSPYGLYVSDFV